MEDLMNVISLTSSEDESTDQVTKRNASFTDEFKIKFDQIFSNHEYMSQKFPHLLFAELLNDIKQFMHNPKYSNAAKTNFWRHFLDKIYKPSLVSQFKIHKDIKFNRLLGAIMAEYLNFRCEILKLEIEKYPNDEMARELHGQVKDLCLKIGTSLLHIFNGNKDFVTFALLQVKPDKHYQTLLSKLFSNVLSYYNKVTMEDHITYVRLILCFRRWKTLVSHAKVKVAINEISRRVLPQNMAGRGSPDTRDFLQILPKHKKDKENATNFLINHKLLEGGLLDKAINRYFDAHEEYAANPNKTQKRPSLVKSSSTTLTEHNLNKFNKSSATPSAVAIPGDNSATIDLSSDDDVKCLTTSSTSNKHNINSSLEGSRLNSNDTNKLVPFSKNTTSICDNRIVDVDEPTSNDGGPLEKAIVENDADSESEQDLHIKNNKLRRKKKKRKNFGKFRQNLSRYESTDSNLSTQDQDDSSNCVRVKLKSQASRNSSQVSSTTNIDSIVFLNPESSSEKCEPNLTVLTKASRESTQSPHISTSNFHDIPLSPVSMPSSSGIVEVGDKTVDSKNTNPLYSDISDTEIDLNCSPPNFEDASLSKGGDAGAGEESNKVITAQCESTTVQSPDSGVSGMNASNSKENSDNEIISVSQVSPPPPHSDFISQCNVADESHCFSFVSPRNSKLESMQNTEAVANEVNTLSSVQNKCLESTSEVGESFPKLQHTQIKNGFVHEVNLQPQSGQIEASYEKKDEFVAETDCKNQSEEDSTIKLLACTDVFEEVEVSTIEFSHEEIVEQNFVQNDTVPEDKEIICQLESTCNGTDTSKSVEALENQQDVPIENDASTHENDLKLKLKHQDNNITSNIVSSEPELKKFENEISNIKNHENLKLELRLELTTLRSNENLAIPSRHEHSQNNMKELQSKETKITNSLKENIDIITPSDHQSECSSTSDLGDTIKTDGGQSGDNNNDTNVLSQFFAISNETQALCLNNNHSSGEVTTQDSQEKSEESVNNLEVIETIHSKPKECSVAERDCNSHFNRIIKCVKPQGQFQRQEILIETDKSNHVEFENFPSCKVAVPLQNLKPNLLQELSNISFNYCKPNTSLIPRKPLTLLLDKKFENISDDEVISKSPTATSSPKDTEVMQILSVIPLEKPKSEFMSYLNLTPNSVPVVEEKPSLIISPTSSISKGRRTKPKCVRKLDTTKPLNALINLQLLATTAVVVSDKPEISKSPKLSKKKQIELKRSIRTKLNDNKRFKDRANRVPTRSSTRSSKSIVLAPAHTAEKSPSITPKSILKTTSNATTAVQNYNMYDGIWQQDRTNEILKTSMDLVKIDVSKVAVIPAIPNSTSVSSDSDSNRLVIADCKVKFDDTVKAITTSGELITINVKDGSYDESDDASLASTNRRKKLTKTRDGNKRHDSESDDDKSSVKSHWPKASKISSSSIEIPNWDFEIDMLNKFEINFPPNDEFNKLQLPLIIKDIPINDIQNSSSLLKFFQIRFIAIHRCIKSFDTKQVVSPFALKGVLEKLQLIQTKSYVQDDLPVLERHLKDLDLYVRKFKKLERNNEKLKMLCDFLKCWDKRIKLRRQRLKAVWNTKDKVNQWHKLIKNGTEMKKNVLNLGVNVLKQKPEQPISDFAQLDQCYKSPQKIFEDTLKHFVITDAQTNSSADANAKATVKQKNKPMLENLKIKKGFKNKSRPSVKKILPLKNENSPKVIDCKQENQLKLLNLENDLGNVLKEELMIKVGKEINKSALFQCLTNELPKNGTDSLETKNDVVLNIKTSNNNSSVQDDEKYCVPKQPEMQQHLDDDKSFNVPITDNIQPENIAEGFSESYEVASADVVPVPTNDADNLLNIKPTSKTSDDELENITEEFDGSLLRNDVAKNAQLTDDKLIAHEKPKEIAKTNDESFVKINDVHVLEEACLVDAKPFNTIDDTDVKSEKIPLVNQIEKEAVLNDDKCFSKTNVDGEKIEQMVFEIGKSGDKANAYIMYVSTNLVERVTSPKIEIQLNTLVETIDLNLQKTPELEKFDESSVQENVCEQVEDIFVELDKTKGLKVITEPVPSVPAIERPIEELMQQIDECIGDINVGSVNASEKTSCRINLHSKIGVVPPAKLVEQIDEPLNKMDNLRYQVTAKDDKTKLIDESVPNIEVNNEESNFSEDVIEIKTNYSIKPYGYSEVVVGTPNNLVEKINETANKIENFHYQVTAKGDKPVLIDECTPNIEETVGKSDQTEYVTEVEANSTTKPIGYSEVVGTPNNLVEKINETANKIENFHYQVTVKGDKPELIDECTPNIEETVGKSEQDEYVTEVEANSTTKPIGYSEVVGASNILVEKIDESLNQVEDFRNQVTTKVNESKFIDESAPIVEATTVESKLTASITEINTTSEEDSKSLADVGTPYEANNEVIVKVIAESDENVHEIMEPFGNDVRIIENVEEMSVTLGKAQDKFDKNGKSEDVPYQKVQSKFNLTLTNDLIDQSDPQPIPLFLIDTATLSIDVEENCETASKQDANEINENKEAVLQSDNLNQLNTQIDTEHEIEVDQSVIATRIEKINDPESKNDQLRSEQRAGSSVECALKTKSAVQMSDNTITKGSEEDFCENNDDKEPETNNSQKIVPEILEAQTSESLEQIDKPPEALAETTPDYKFDSSEAADSEMSKTIQISEENVQNNSKSSPSNIVHSSDSSVDYVEESTKIETRSNNKVSTTQFKSAEEEDELVQREDKRIKVVQEIQSEIVKIISNTSEMLRAENEILKRRTSSSPESSYKSKIPKIEIDSPNLPDFAAEYVSNENVYSDNSCHSNKSGIDFPEYLVSNVSSSVSEPSALIPLIAPVAPMSVETESASITPKSDGSDKLDIVESLISKNLLGNKQIDDELGLDGLRDFFCLYDEYENHNVLDRSNTSLNWEHEYSNSLNLVLNDLIDNETSSDNNDNMKKEKDCMISGKDVIRMSMAPWDSIQFPLSYSMDPVQDTCVNMGCILENKNKVSPIIGSTEQEADNIVPNTTEPSSYMMVDIFANKSFDEVIYNEDQSNSTLVDQTIKELSNQLPTEDEDKTLKESGEAGVTSLPDDLVVFDPHGDTENNVESPNPSYPKSFQQSVLVTINHDDIKENDSKSENFELINVFLNRGTSKISNDPIEILSDSLDSSRSSQPSISEGLTSPVREDVISANEEESTLSKLTTATQQESSELETYEPTMTEEVNSPVIEINEGDESSISQDESLESHKSPHRKDNEKLDENVIILKKKPSIATKRSPEKSKLENIEIPIQLKSTPIPLSKHIPSPKLKRTPAYTYITPPTTPTNTPNSLLITKAELNYQKTAFSNLSGKPETKSYKNGPLDMPNLDFDEDSNCITQFIIPKPKPVQALSPLPPPLPPPLVLIQPPPPPFTSPNLASTPSKQPNVKVRPVIETRAEMTSFLNASVTRVKRPAEVQDNQSVGKKSKVDKFDLVKSMPVDKLSPPHTNNSTKGSKSYSFSHHSSGPEKSVSLNLPVVNGPMRNSNSTSQPLSPGSGDISDSGNASKKYCPGYSSSSKEREYRSSSVNNQSSINFSKPYPQITKPIIKKYVPISAPLEPTLRTYRSKSKLTEPTTKVPEFKVVPKEGYEHSYSSSGASSVLWQSSSVPTSRLVISEKNQPSRSLSSHHYGKAPKNKYAVDLCPNLAKIGNNKNSSDFYKTPSWEPKQFSNDELLEELKRVASQPKSNSSQLFN